MTTVISYLCMQHVKLDSLVSTLQPTVYVLRYFFFSLLIYSTWIFTLESGRSAHFMDSDKTSDFRKPTWEMVYVKDLRLFRQRQYSNDSTGNISVRFHGITQLFFIRSQFKLLESIANLIFNKVHINFSRFRQKSSMAKIVKNPGLYIREIFEIGKKIDFN